MKTFDNQGRGLLRLGLLILAEVRGSNDQEHFTKNLSIFG